MCHHLGDSIRVRVRVGASKGHKAQALRGTSAFLSAPRWSVAVGCISKVKRKPKVTGRRLQVTGYRAHFDLSSYNFLETDNSKYRSEWLLEGEQKSEKLTQKLRRRFVFTHELFLPPGHAGSSGLGAGGRVALRRLRPCTSLARSRRPRNFTGFRLRHRRFGRADSRRRPAATDRTAGAVADAGASAAVQACAGAVVVGAPCAAPVLKRGFNPSDLGGVPRLAHAARDVPEDKPKTQVEGAKVRK